jgi:hypothetical protein
MLDALDAFVKALLVVPTEDRDRSLMEDLATIHFVVDEMDRGPRQLDSGVERITHGVGTREGRKQGRVQVYQAAPISIDEHGRQDPHEPRAYDEVGRVGGHACAERLTPLLA